MLKDRCHINTNRKTDTFVGLEFDGKNYTVSFPLGYAIASEDDDKLLREDLLLLFYTLALYSNHTESKSGFKREKDAATETPMYAYIYIIMDFVTRGYYKEGIVEYASSKRGKIHWNRTIKQKKPVIQEADIYYLDFITKKNVINENDLITLIHQYCVYLSFIRFGWLFTDYEPPEPQIPIHRQWFSAALQEKLCRTFNDANKMLFANMLKIINNEPDEGMRETSFTFGTNRFEYVWEKMIDTAFGISDKQRYFPKTKWKLAHNGKEYDNSKLEPDTIMLYNNNIYVLDAKYYKYGATKNSFDLPESASINKQITYGEYIDAQADLKNPDSVIYNAFLMPFDKNHWAEENAGTLHYAGEAVALWKDAGEGRGKEYEHIQGILLDVKHLMQIAEKRSETDIRQLAEIIEEHCSDHGQADQGTTS